MRIVTSIAELKGIHVPGTSLVPTMGAFHEGHLELMRRARHDADCVVVSLFVNPTQFGPDEDFAKYPRNLDQDAALAESAGVDVLFAPSVEEIYSPAPTLIYVPEVTALWEGAFRPTHFQGVATIVLKLFNIVAPKRAYFGQKDLQQCLVIRRMVRDLNVPVDLCFEPTVREQDGLAMSSRNVYLSSEERAKAPLLAATLDSAAKALARNQEDPSSVLLEHQSRLSSAGFETDYFEWVDLEAMHPCRSSDTPSAVITAAKLGRTRLIDNKILGNGRLI